MRQSVSMAPPPAHCHARTITRSAAHPTWSNGISHRVARLSLFERLSKLLHDLCLTPLVLVSQFPRLLSTRLLRLRRHNPAAHARPSACCSPKNKECHCCWNAHRSPEHCRRNPTFQSQSPALCPRPSSDTSIPFLRRPAPAHSRPAA